MSLHELDKQQRRRRTTGWSQTYWGISELAPNLVMKWATQTAAYHAVLLGVPVGEIHAYWDYDYLDPLGNAMTMGWRENWGADCINKCKLHQKRGPLR